MPKYRKKPVVVEAVRWTGENVQEIGAFDSRIEIAEADRLAIPTLEGEMRADPGDWIIRGVKGEVYPCKPDIFAATYDEDVEPCRTHVFVAGLRRCRRCGLEVQIGDGV